MISGRGGTVPGYRKVIEPREKIVPGYRRTVQPREKIVPGDVWKIRTSQLKEPGKGRER